MTPRLFLLAVLPFVSGFVFSQNIDFQRQNQNGVFRILEKETDALQCRLDLIRQAKSEILLSYYIFKEDEIGNSVLQLLLEAAHDRGVKVRLMIDSNAGKISKKTIGVLRENGVEMQVFKIRGRWLFHRFTHRLHDKILLTDGKNLIVGGRNIKSEYFKNGQRLNFRDLDVFTTGDSACREARVHFYSIWNCDLISEQAKNKTPDSTTRIEVLENLRLAKEKLPGLLPVRFDSSRVWASGFPPTTAPVRFVHDDFFKKQGKDWVEADQKDRRSTQTLIDLIDSTKTSLWIENAYFNPTKLWWVALERAVRRGVKIRLLTNSIKSNDVFIYQASYLNCRKKMLRLGLEIWEYQGPQTLHTKAFVMDGNIAVVGSYNIHQNSQIFNTEVGLWVADPTAAENLRNIMETTLENAVRIGPNNRPEIPPGKNYRPARFGKRLLVWLSRFTISRFVG